MRLDELVPEWIRTLAPYSPGMPVEELERQLGIRDSIKLASNENPLGPSRKAVAALEAALANLHRYPDGSACYLKNRLAERLGVTQAELIVGNGSNEIIELVVRTVLRPGEEAVMADQAFVVYRLVVQAAGGTSRIVPLRDFTHDLEAMAAAVGPRTRLVFLANPNNPTGTIFRRAAWERFLARMPPHVVVVADDAYASTSRTPSTRTRSACGATGRSPSSAYAPSRSSTASPASGSGTASRPPA
jgi:histidinol-phosphate aminotransferase